MKTSSIVTLLSIASGLLLTASAILAGEASISGGVRIDGSGITEEQVAALEASPDEPAAPFASRLERQDQPYLLGPGQFTTSVSLAPFGSVQVNVDIFGRNIIGDAANEPSIATDPTSTSFFDPGGRPSRIAIGWRQFDTVASNFRQAGYAFSINGGANWTKRVLDPGVFRSDPILVADNAGTLYYNSLRTDSDFSFLCVDVWRSNRA